MKHIKEFFTEIFTLLAWFTLFAFIFYCALTGNKTDSVRDAWNVIILIAGFVWGSKHQKSLDANKTTTEVTQGVTTITQEPVNKQDEISKGGKL